MLRISWWVSVALLVLETALVGTTAQAQSPGGFNNQRLSWAPVWQTTPGAYDWSGFYVGASGGGAWSPSRNIFVNETFNGDPFFDGPFGSRNVQGGFGGANFGYGSMHDRWYFGGEFDAYFGSIHGRSNEIMPYLFPGNTMMFRTDECADFIGTLSGRIGYAFDRVLVYGIAGAAVADTNIRFKMMDTFGFDADARSKGVRGGYVVGAGAKYAINGNWSIKAEYQYIDVGNAQVAGREFGQQFQFQSPFTIYNTTRINYNTFLIGVDHKFGGTAIATLGH